MIRTVYDGGRLPAAERLALINQGLRTATQPMTVRSPDPGAFRAVVRELDLAPVNVTALSTNAAEVRRTQRLIRAADPRQWTVVLARQGRVDLSQRGHSVTMAPGTLALGDSSHPFAMRLTQGAEIVSAHLPAEALPLAAGRVDRLLPLHFPEQTGIASLLAQSLSGFVDDATRYHPAEAPQLGAVVVDLVTAVLSHELRSRHDLRDDAHQRILLLEIENFITRHLGDHDLTPRAIATAHNISVSYLHRVFQGRGTTVAASIRSRRLERARHDLGDPTLRSLPVGRIAARWGFADHATFTRAFKAAYDIAPIDYRHSTLSDPPGRHRSRRTR